MHGIFAHRNLESSLFKNSADVIARATSGEDVFGNSRTTNEKFQAVNA